MGMLHGWLGLVFGFSGLIFIHELGHFLLAKWNGVKVHVFSLGMGPYLFSFTWRGTVYVLSMLPIGGYVKMAGQDDLNPDLDVSKDPSDYRNKKVGQRAQILAAGAIFNVIFTIFAFTACYWHGLTIEPPRLGLIRSDKPLGEAVLACDPSTPALLHEGDRIINVNGVPVKTFLEALLQISSCQRNQDVILRIERNNDADVMRVRDRYVDVKVKAEPDKKLGAQSIGLEPWTMNVPLSLGFTTQDKVVLSESWSLDISDESKVDAATLKNIQELRDQPAYKKLGSKLKAGDQIVSVNGKAVKRVEDLLMAGSASKGAAIKFEFKHNEETSFVDEITPFYDEKATTHRFGIPAQISKNVAKIDPKSEAYTAGLREGNYVFIFDPEEPDEWDSALRPVWKSGKLVYGVAWNTKPENHTKIDLKVGSDYSREALIYVEQATGQEYLKREGFCDSVSTAWGDTVRFSTGIFSVLRGLFSGDVSPKALSGGVGIGQVVYKVAAQQTIWKFLWFLGFISLNLGVMQFIPIPLLDGWHLLMLLVEKLKGSPVAPKIQEAFTYVGFFIVGSLLLFATYNDLSRIFFKQ